MKHTLAPARNVLAEAISPFKRETSGNLFRRSLAARALASLHRRPLADVVEDNWPTDRLLVQMVSRGAVLPAMTGTAGWAAELAQRRVADTVAALGAVSGAADVLKASLVLDWDGAGAISAPGFVTSANNSSFVAEGAPIPVRQLTSGPALLLPYKLATIAVLTREMVESGNAEALIADALVRSTGLALDAVFFGSAAATAAQPAGIRNGIATTTASNSTDLYEAFAQDLAALVNAVSVVGGRGPFIIVASAGRIATMTLHYMDGDSDSDTFIFVPSSAVGDDMVVIAGGAIAAALSAEPDVEMATTSTLVMDTAPGAAGTAGPERELFQTESMAVKVRWPVSWVLRDSRAVAWLTPAWK
jgi:hypothetical protein